MTAFQKVIKYLAIGLAAFLSVSIIGGILGVIGLFAGDTVTEELKAYKVSSQTNALDVEINAADFTIKEGESFLVESNLKHLTVEDKNGVLTIKETKKLNGTYKGAVLTLYIPADTVFEKVHISTGAGRLTVKHLSADSVDFEFGAGEVVIEKLDAASHADLEGGAGKVTVSGGELRNLNLDMGVGQLNLTSALTGKCEFDLGVGETNITVIGNRQDYRLDIEKGVGDITLDGKSVSNIKGSGNGSNSIEIHGGVGSIHLNYQDAKTE